MKETSRYIPSDWNLKNWARIAYAASLWDKPTIESLIEAKSETELTAQIKELVGKKGKEIHLPKAILDEVLFTFKSMGQRIHAWCNYARTTLQIPKDIAERVHWTIDGTIDERTILQDLICSETFREKRNLVPIETIYSLACSNLFTEYIELHWDEMLTFYGVHEKSVIFYYMDFEPAKGLIIASVIFFANRNDSRIPVSFAEKYSDAKNMLILSIKGGYVTAAQYYWCQLNENQKNELIVSIAQEVNTQCFLFSGDTKRYKNQCVGDLLIFFLNSMSDDDLKMWEGQRSEGGDMVPRSFDHLMYHCPLEEYLPLAYRLTSNYCRDGFKCHMLVYHILRSMEINNAFGFWNKQYFARKLFKFVWDKPELGTSNAEEFFDDNKELVVQIFDIFDLEILNFIINTRYDEGKTRCIIISNAHDSFVKMIKANKRELLETFASNILKCEKDRIWFRDIFCKYLFSIYG